MDGMVMAKQIRKADLLKRVRIILCSADEPPEDFDPENIFDEIKVKPLKMNDLDEMYKWMFKKNEAVRIAVDTNIKGSQNKLNGFLTNRKKSVNNKKPEIKIQDQVYEEKETLNTNDN